MKKLLLIAVLLFPFICLAQDIYPDYPKKFKITHMERGHFDHLDRLITDESGEMKGTVDINYNGTEDIFITFGHEMELLYKRKTTMESKGTDGSWHLTLRVDNPSGEECWIRVYPDHMKISYKDRWVKYYIRAIK